MAQEDQMLQEHQQAYKGFVKFSTIGTVLLAVVLALMALTLL
jgi:aa3 type cytochrome c oxidase subunit IV